MLQSHVHPVLQSASLMTVFIYLTLVLIGMSIHLSFVFSQRQARGEFMAEKGIYVRGDSTIVILINEYTQPASQ